MSPVGADGLTNEQWIESSRVGANKDLVNIFRKENKDNSDPDKHKTTTDAGHGDNNNNNSVHDPGAIATDDKTQYEKDYALMVEKAVNDWLLAFGVDNQRTRNGDIDVPDESPLVWRYQLANDNNSEIFLSFHLDQALDTRKLKLFISKEKKTKKQVNTWEV
ncbi:MAG: N-acetylmuramoyl-L-alanine amidase [Bacteroidota bacterium]